MTRTREIRNANKIMVVNLLENVHFEDRERERIILEWNLKRNIVRILSNGKIWYHQVLLPQYQIGLVADLFHISAL